MDNPLFAVRDFVKVHKVASPSQIAFSLELPKGTVEHALNHWIQRGLIEINSPICSSGSSCNHCTIGGCHPPEQVYHWHA